MRFWVVGSGGVGGTIGCHLLRSDEHEVVFFARGQHLAAMREQGLRIRTERDEILTLPVKATDDPASADRPDAILLTVKAYDVRAAAEMVRPFVDYICPVVTFQNGVDAPYEVADVVGPEHVLAASIAIGCHIEAPGFIAGPMESSMVIIAMGSMDGCTSERARCIQQAFETVNIRVELHEDIRTMLWRKLMLVGPRSVIQALTRCRSLARLWGNPRARRLLQALWREYRAVGEAEGAGLPYGIFEELAKPLSEGQVTTAITVIPGQMPSLLRAVLHGQPLEVEAMIGSVVHRAKRHGIAVPNVRMCYALLSLVDEENRAALAGKA